MRLFGELTKIEEQPDGTLKVYGVASTGARDEAGEVVLPAAMKAALPDYARYPALREMHQPTAAGRTLEATVDDDGATRIVAQVVDPVAIAKVKSRTYAGFSIGGRVIARDPADATIITRIDKSVPGAQTALAVLFQAADAAAVSLQAQAAGGLADLVAGAVEEAGGTVANLISASGLDLAAKSALSAADVATVTAAQSIAHNAISVATARLLGQAAGAASQPLASSPPAANAGAANPGAAA